MNDERCDINYQQKANQRFTFCCPSGAEKPEGHSAGEWGSGRKKKKGSKHWHESHGMDKMCTITLYVVQPFVAFTIRKYKNPPSSPERVLTRPVTTDKADVEIWTWSNLVIQQLWNGGTRFMPQSCSVFCLLSLNCDEKKQQINFPWWTLPPPSGLGWLPRHTWNISG